MVDTFVVVAVLLITLVLSAVVSAYRRFSAVRTRLLAHLATAAPEIIPDGLTDTGFRVRALGAEIAVDLATHLRRRRRGQAEIAWFDEVTAGIRARVPVPDIPPLALVQDRIIPQLKSRDFVAVFARYPDAQHLVSRPLAAGIEITYAIRGVHQLTAVTQRALAVWRCSADTLHALAMANMRAQTAHLLDEIGGPRRRYEHLDGLDATRILLADLIVPSDVREPVAAIPEESVLLLAPAADAGALAAEAAALYEKTPRPLSRTVFRLGPGPGVGLSLAAVVAPVETAGNTL